MCNSQKTCYQFLLVYLISKQQRTSRTKPHYKNQASLSNLLFRQVSLLTLLFSLSCRSQTILRPKLKILLLDNWYLQTKNRTGLCTCQDKAYEYRDDLKHLSGPLHSCWWTQNCTPAGSARCPQPCWHTCSSTVPDNPKPPKALTMLHEIAFLT